MNKITKADIPESFLAILDAYEATEKFILNFNVFHIKPDQALKSILASNPNFRVFIKISFSWNEFNEGNYWCQIANQKPL